MLIKCCCCHFLAFSSSDAPQEDGKLAADVSQQLEHDALHKVQVVHVKERTSALELWEPLCGPEALVRRKPLLLLTHEFTILDQATSLREMAELMLIMDQVRSLPAG